MDDPSASETRWDRPVPGQQYSGSGLALDGAGAAEGDVGLSKGSMFRLLESLGRMETWKNKADSPDEEEAAMSVRVGGTNATLSIIT